MLTDTQRMHIVNFVVNFLHIIHAETNVTQEQAEVMVRLGIATLLGAVLCLPPPTDDDIDDTGPFVVDVIATALAHEYGKDTASVL